MLLLVFKTGILKVKKMNDSKTNLCKDCEHWDGFGFAKNAGWCEKKDIGTSYNDRCDDINEFEEYDEYQDPYENEIIKFIWGVKSWDDLCDSDACLYTMNDIELVCLKDENKYTLGLETIFEFENEEDKMAYLNSCLDAFTKFMVENGYNTEVKPHWYDVFMGGMSEHFDNIEECYGMFKLLVNGYCS